MNNNLEATINPLYSILVNTCDKFEDCWNPFFKLFSTFWNSYNGKIYLNTEYKDYSYSNLNIIPTKVCAEKKDAPIITWSECLKRALDSIDSEIVLYMQEDYFLKDKVQNDIIDKYAQLMQEHKDVHCIHLTDQAVIAEEKSVYENLDKVTLKQRYRISCQAALWRKDVLISYLRSYESAWDFEEFGSKRASILNHNFYVVDNAWVRLNKFEIIPYIFTGIVQGKWKEEVKPLFKAHNINVDYSVRGFVSIAERKSLNRKFKYHINRVPIWIKNYRDILNLKRG